MIKLQKHRFANSYYLAVLAPIHGTNLKVLFQILTIRNKSKGNFTKVYSIKGDGLKNLHGCRLIGVRWVGL